MELEVIVKEECKPAIEVLRDQDPHDLISPDTWFTSDYCFQKIFPFHIPIAF